MTYLEALRWLADQKYNALFIPCSGLEYCVKASNYVPLEKEIEEERASPREGQFFIEVARNRHGDAMPWIYAYPRPASMTTDISLAVDAASALPPERQVENVLADYPGWFEAPYVAGALRASRMVSLPTGYVLWIEREPVH